MCCVQKVVKEKNALAERLKNAEAARKRFDEELKRIATENVTREEIRQSLEDEVRRLTQTVGQTEGEKREKEEQVTRCEVYIDGMESKLQACQVCLYIEIVILLLLFIIYDAYVCNSYDEITRYCSGGASSFELLCVICNMLPVILNFK